MGWRDVVDVDRMVLRKFHDDLFSRVFVRAVEHLMLRFDLLAALTLAAVICRGSISNHITVLP